VRAFIAQKKNIPDQSFNAESGAIWQSFGKGCFFRKFGFSGRMQIIIASRKKAVLNSRITFADHTDRQRRSGFGAVSISPFCNSGGLPLCPKTRFFTSLFVLQ
jgi:hypothetical protein